MGDMGRIRKELAECWHDDKSGVQVESLESLDHLRGVIRGLDDG